MKRQRKDNYMSSFHGTIDVTNIIKELRKIIDEKGDNMEKSKVYFIKEINSKNLVKIYDALGIKLKGKVAVKVHSGEAGNQNYLHPEFMKEIIEHVNGTVVECNTAYPGERTNNEDHFKLLADHGWTKYYNVDILDEEGDYEEEIPNGITIKKDYLGTHMKNYDSVLVLSHFKGHPMGGFGGALKQLSIGFASRRGKAYIHGAGTTEDANYVWSHLPEQNIFLESMADAASCVNNHFKNNIAFINVMANMSVDCDCCHIAEDPCMIDIGILASTDPIAIDKACLDLVHKSNDPGKEHFLKRVNRQNGEYIIEAADKLNFVNSEYELIILD